MAATASGHGRRKPDWVVKEVLRLATFLRSCRAVAAAFNALHGQRATVCKTYVHALCRSRASELRLLRRGMRAAPARAVPVGRAFALDLTSVQVAGERCTVLGVLDQGSRLVLRLKVLAHKCTWSLLEQLCGVIGEYGLPGSIRTDNEGMFSGWVWRAALKCMGIRHERIAVRCAWQNGRMERLFGTLKPLLAQLSLPSPMALQVQGALDEFTLFYNHVRVRAWAGSPRRKRGAA